MGSIRSVRRIAVVFLVGGGVALGQSTLPAITPTSVPGPASGTPLASTMVTPRTTSPARVGYVEGQLTVIADNSSLNQILREVGRLTGMKITGGVAEQRVFGKYGPGASAEILAGLLDGTGSNMLLIAHQSGAPQELILTPREGSVTTPNPNAAGFDDDAPTPEQALEPPQVPVSQPGPPSPPMGAAAAPTSASAPAASDPASTTTTPSTATGNPPSPNGVPTPRQIYQQLLQLQQAQSPR